ncbi:phospholipid-translocating P-type ATPase [Xylariaceae sp. FL0594]|nr:phospholipid-translocating P-type ATPase [Xylariaceae sp. FL0594]
MASHDLRATDGPSPSVASLTGFEVQNARDDEGAGKEKRRQIAHLRSQDISQQDGQSLISPRLHGFRLRMDRWLRGASALETSVKETCASCFQRWIIEELLRQKPLPPSADGRHIPLVAGKVRTSPLVDERSGKHYGSNRIRSSRYSLVSFLPKQLFFQFSRLANFYFLVIGLLQQVKGWSPTGRYTTIGPLAAFIAITMAKEGYDDYRRYRLDKEDNLALASVLVPSSDTNDGPDPGDSSIGRVFHRKRSEEKASLVGSCKGPPELSGSRWGQIRWRDIRVGDIVRLQRNEKVPADIVLLHATGPNSTAYIDTMALDGETNLKSKQPPLLVANRCDTVAKLEECRGELVCEDPNPNLYQFEGRMTIDRETTPLTLNEVVFRGSTIRNTTETIGVVVNTGEECKIRMNANQYVHTKSPKINRYTNRIVLCLVLVLLSITAGLSGGYVLWQRQYEKKNPFLRPMDAGSIIFGDLILVNGLIPLTLYIVIEIVKGFQAYLLDDIEMYDPATDTPVSINTNTILEDLGQVDYVFSDKTGTLTENNMQFRKLTVGGTSWLHRMNMTSDETEWKQSSDADDSTPDGQEVDNHELTAGGSKTGRLGQTVSPSGPTTESMLDYIQRFPDTVFSQKARHFLLCIALCNTCLPEISEDGKITFQAASPDEVALVQAAQDMGYHLVDRPAQSIKLKVTKRLGEPVIESYEVLKVIEFSSNRKRMSIILRMPDGRICVICKGADNVIIGRLRNSALAAETAAEVERKASMRRSVEAEKEMRRRSLATPRNSHGRRPSFFLSRSASSFQQSRLKPRTSKGEDAEHSVVIGEPVMRPRDNSDEVHENVVDESVVADETKVFESCFRHIDEYATEGLRTLLYGYKYISTEEFEEWNTAFQAATTSLVDRQKRIEEAAESIERDFELAGGSAIEDKLQAGVPETIDKLRRANIKVWMLTGDKRETAINIARSANLAKTFSHIHILDAPVSDLRVTMRRIFIDISRGQVSHSVLVIDGLTLGIIEDDGVLRAMFFELAALIDSVICCRASPSQKATLVKGVRDANPFCVTLAIGDGANDIAMIQASHVGIGISGREGLQAARVADYSIAQFRFLQRLLLVHGHWLYIRTSKYILCTFWKEWVFYLAQAQYQRLNGYSGTSLYQSWSLTTYNAIFTSLPIFFLGLCEQDLSAETLLAVPELYTSGQRDEGVNVKKCIFWLFTGAIDTVLVFTIVWLEFLFNLNSGPNDVHGRGHDNSLFPMGSLALTILIAHINIKILILELHHKTWLPLAACAFSISTWFFFNLIIGAVPAKYSADAPYRITRGFIGTFGNALSWWAVAIIGVFTVAGLNLGITAFQRVFFPTDRNLWQEMEQQGVTNNHGTDEAGRSASIIYRDPPSEVVA